MLECDRINMPEGTDIKKPGYHLGELLVIIITLLK